MASITVYFRNGDFLSLGCTLDFGNIAYNALVNEDEGFITLGVVDNMPRFAIRSADVIAAVMDPNDNATFFLSSAGVRSTEIRTRILAPPGQTLPANVQQPNTSASTSSPEQQTPEPQYRDANALLGAFVAHLVDNRIRIRALLRVLGGTVDREVFEAALKEVSDADREALTQEILLTEESFRRLFADWITFQNPSPQVPPE